MNVALECTKCSTRATTGCKAFVVVGDPVQLNRVGPPSLLTYERAQLVLCADCGRLYRVHEAVDGVQYLEEVRR